MGGVVQGLPIGGQAPCYWGKYSHFLRQKKTGGKITGYRELSKNTQKDGAILKRYKRETSSGTGSEICLKGA